MNLNNKTNRHEFSKNCFPHTLLRFGTLLTPACFLLLLNSFLSSCDNQTEPPPVPPTVLSVSPDTLGAFDTLRIVLSKPVKENFALEYVSQLSLDSKPASGAEFTSVNDSLCPFNLDFSEPNQILLYGKKKVLGRSFFTLPKFIKLRLDKLTDLEGTEASGPQILSLPRFSYLDRDQSHPDSLVKILDSAAINQNSRAIPNTALAWNNAHPTDSLLLLNKAFTSEGALLGNLGNDRFDYDDYKLLFLGIEDSLSLNFLCPASSQFSLSLHGPYPWNHATDSIQPLIDALNANTNPNDKRLKLLSENCTPRVNKISKGYRTTYSQHAKYLKSASTDRLGAYILIISTPNRNTVGPYRLTTQILTR